MPPPPKPTKTTASIVLTLLLLLTTPAASTTLETNHFSIDYELTGPHAVNLTDDIDQNGHPDYIDSLARFAAEAWAIITDTLGFPAPVPLGGSFAKFTIKVRDIYTWDTARKWELGYCTTTAESRSELLIENDFKWSASGRPSSDLFYCDTGWTFVNNFIDPFPRMKVTLFHELFHASQAIYLQNSPTSLWESAASWFEAQWTGYFSEAMGLAYFRTIGKGWFSNDSAAECGNFSFLLYAEETLGRGFVKNLHEYRSRHIPDSPGDPHAEARNFHEFCEAYGYAEKELLKGFTEEVAAIIDYRRGSKVLAKLEAVFGYECLSRIGTISGPDLSSEEKVAWRGEPFGMTVFKLPIRSWTFTEGSAIEMRVAGNDEWGYIVPVMETDSSRIMMPTVYVDRSHPLHLPLPKGARRLSLFIHQNWAGIKGEFQMILPADYPWRKPKPLAVYDSVSSPVVNSPAFDQNLETLWNGRAITMDFGEGLWIGQCVLYSNYPTYPEMKIYCSSSIDSVNFHRELGKQCLGNIMIHHLNSPARYVHLECVGFDGIQGIEEFEVLAPRPPVNAGRTLPVVAARATSIGTRGNRLVIYRQPDMEALYRVFSLDGRIAGGFVHASGVPFISKPLSSGTYIVRLFGKTSGEPVRVVVP